MFEDEGRRLGQVEMRPEEMTLSLHLSKYEATSASLTAPVTLSAESRSPDQREIDIQQNVGQYCSDLPSSKGRHLEGAWPTSQSGPLSEDRGDRRAPHNERKASTPCPEPPAHIRNCA